MDIAQVSTYSIQLSHNRKYIKVGFPNNSLNPAKEGDIRKVAYEKEVFSEYQYQSSVMKNESMGSVGLHVPSFKVQSKEL